MNLADLELFIQVVDAGSLSVAARLLISPAVASVALKRFGCSWARSAVQPAYYA